MVVPPRIKECIPGPCETSSDFQVKKPSSVPGRCEPMSRYISLITETEKVKVDCRMGEAVQVEIPSREEDITKHKASFLSVYTYPFFLGLVEASSPPIDPVILDFCRQYRVTVRQIYPSF